MTQRLILLSGIVMLWGCSSRADKNNTLPTVNYQALGTQPNWSVEVSNKSMSFSSEDFDRQQTFDVVKSGDGDDGEIISYDSVDPRQSLSLVLKPKPCLDFVSGQKLPFFATLTFGDITYLGCAQRIDN